MGSRLVFLFLSLPLQLAEKARAAPLPGEGGWPHRGGVDTASASLPLAPVYAPGTIPLPLSLPLIGDDSPPRRPAPHTPVGATTAWRRAGRQRRRRWRRRKAVASAAAAAVVDSDGRAADRRGQDACQRVGDGWQTGHAHVGTVRRYNQLVLKFGVIKQTVQYIDGSKRIYACTLHVLYIKYCAKQQTLSLLRK